jgi:hypothetical protein
MPYHAGTDCHIHLPDFITRMLLRTIWVFPLTLSPSHREKSSEPAPSGKDFDKAVLLYAFFDCAAAPPFGFAFPPAAGGVTFA